jgi:hypothetical protein
VFTSFARGLLGGFIHFPNLLVVHKFRCPHHPSALAEHANLLAKRAICFGFGRFRLLVITIVASHWTVPRLRVPSVLSAWLAMGCIALAPLLIAELALVRLVRGISIREYLATRDRVAGNVYYVMLVIFTVIPLLVARRPWRRRPRWPFPALPLP